MFPGSPARLRPRVQLRDVLALARPGAVLGAWLRGCTAPLAIRAHGPAGTLHLLAAEDLGLLVAGCRHVVIRDGERILAVPSAVLVGWRVLEVALLLGLGSAEEALAACAAARLPVAASRIGYLADKR